MANDESIKKHVSRRLVGLKAQRQSFEGDAKEIASYALPARSRFLSSQTNRGRQPNRKLNNSHGILSFRTLQSGMTSGLSSQSRPWFKLTDPDEETAEDPAAKGYYELVQQKLEDFFAASNFYGAVKTGYLEMGAFGTDACIMVEHPTERAVCHAMTFGEYWIGLNSANQAGALYRDCAMTVLQAMEHAQKQGWNVSPRIRNAYDSSRYDEICQFFHAIEENPDYQEGKLGYVGKPWRSIYWDAADDRVDALVSLSGYEEQPFWAPRWDTTGADTYGQGPGHDALPDLRELQLQTKRKAEVTDNLVWPEIIATTKAKLKRQPKSVVNAAEIDVSKATHVPYQVPYQALAAVMEDVNRLEGKVDELTFSDLFKAITNMQGVQPRNIEEIAARNEEKMTLLGPVIERVNNEKLEIAVRRAFGILTRLGQLPPPPEAFEGREPKVEFVSILTQMQRMVGAGQIERGVGFIGNLAAASPEALDKLNVDETVDEYANRIGLPAKLIRNADEVAEIRAARAQQQQMEQMVASMPAVKDGADAAALMAETSADSLPFAGAMPL